MRRALAGAALLVAVLGARADEAPPVAPEKPTHAYGADHPDCVEWTDGCLVCARQADGEAACSMVGAACLPAAVSCLKNR
jgi:hypothetical protein